MLTKTHLVFSILLGLVFIPIAKSPLLFSLSLVFSTFLPDLDSYHSKLGKRFISRSITSFTKHRGFMHSLLFLLIVYFLLRLYLPLLSLGFLIGYGSHLLGDSFTKRGVRLFYPLKFKLKGFMKTGGVFETFLFVIFGIVDLFLIVNLFLRSIF